MAGDRKKKGSSSDHCTNCDALQELMKAMQETNKTLQETIKVLTERLNTVEETLTQMKSGNQDGSSDISSGIGKRIKEIKELF